MKAPSLLICLLVFVACCLFTWKVESTLGTVIGYISLMILIIVIGNSLIEKPMPGSR